MRRALILPLVAIVMSFVGAPAARANSRSSVTRTGTASGSATFTFATNPPCTFVLVSEDGSFSRPDCTIDRPVSSRLLHDSRCYFKMSDLTPTTQRSTASSGSRNPAFNALRVARLHANANPRWFPYRARSWSFENGTVLPKRKQNCVPPV